MLFLVVVWAQSWRLRHFDNTFSCFSNWAVSMNDGSMKCPGKCEQFCERSTRKYFFHKHVPILPTSYIQSWGLSTPESCTFWAFEPGPSAPTLWWSSFSPYQTKARTISEAGACLVDWIEAWTASEIREMREKKQKSCETQWGSSGWLKTSAERVKNHSKEQI